MPASSVVLLTRPSYDIATAYLHAWSQELKEIAEQKGVTIVDLEQRKATQKNFISCIEKTDPSLILFNGHAPSKHCTDMKTNCIPA
ncbi:MAG: hypothetical protein HY832_02300 [Candidatus Aenigmarchaeota archaeon]|nr:hypothetical protein [Candidatus Aenigmarchaeota archaeon]